ncbi:hypothetical protein AAF712_008679 [Marasmius tenuissimus]|uniref:ASX DEUBAD domain-containing protein n=1 Tax=Marasmius tenuissimus TaxID=585030 RepID=A0ABR2ZTI4_9AGAR|nr:hypothetical protein PM082_010552 [Marasmius tenuissimus]
MTSTGRPKRTTRQTAKLVEAEIQEKTTAKSSPPKGKRKASTINVNEDDGEYELTDLLQYSKSVLTTMDISTLINSATWEMLSPESRANLAQLLPPTAFKGYKQTIGHEHPACQSTTGVELEAGPSSKRRDAGKDTHDPTTVDLNFFSDLHFLAAARTFQDHIYSDWLSDEHKAKVKDWEEAVREGKTAAPWKDEEWEKNAAAEAEEENETANSNTNTTKPKSSKAKPASEIRLHELMRHSIIRVGDVLSYKRHFNQLDLVVEKDVIINDSHQQTLTIFLERGTTQHLPLGLLLPDPQPDPDGTTQSIEITSPTMLETAILDIDGRVGKDRRPNGNAWKYFTVWRWRDGAEGTFGGDERGGRESHGTLYYLRGSFHSDR